MKGAFLDWNSLNGSELEQSCLQAVPVDWTIYPEISRERLEQDIGQYEVIVTNKVVIDELLMQQARALKLICVAATGTNNIDLLAAKKYNIPVCNVTAYANDSVVQHVFMLIFNLCRAFVPYQSDLKSGAWSKSPFFCLYGHPISSIKGKTIGIIGYGELGQAVAKTASHFGMNVLIAQSLAGVDTSIPGRVALDMVLSESDVISLHCPLSEASRNLINQTAFAKMKSTAVLINTARGGIVNEADLLMALRSGRIAGAALDVLEQEPPATDHPLLTSGLNNLIITPHIAWASLQARQLLLNKIIENIQSWLAGELLNEVCQ